MTYHDISGVRYGRLVAKERVGKKWLFVCDCGNEKLIWATNVKRGHTQSCGCFHRESASYRAKIDKKTHGWTNTPEYRTWQGINQRCGNLNDKSYQNYGGRGISVEWMDFDSFLSDMGKRPSPKHSLERENVNGNYCKDNCRWATSKEQNSNKRTNIRVNAFGRSGCLADFIFPYSAQYQKARKLIHKGVAPERAITMALG